MRLLFVEDSVDDLDLMTAALRRFGFDFEHQRVDTLDRLASALEDETWSAVISDYHLPGFIAVDALRVVRERRFELPFILVSGALGEERAVEMIRAGANDCVMKDRLVRLGPAIERELRDVQLREERRTLFTAYRRSEDRYRRVVETAPIGVAVSSPDGQLLIVNEHLLRILGHTRDEMLGTNIATLGLGTGRPDAQRFVRPDGETVWITVSAAPVMSDDLAVEQVVWLIDDVTAVNRTAEELRTQREQLEEAQRMARVGSYEVDLVTGRRLWSAELRRLCGIDSGGAAEMQRIDVLLHPDDRARVLRKREDVLRTLEPYFDEHRLVLPGGITRIMQERVRIIRDTRGNATKLIGIVQDVTDVRLQEEELQRRAVQQVVVANLGHDALSGAPVEALVEQVAEAVTRLLGVDLCQILQVTGTRHLRVFGGAGCEINFGTVIDAHDASMAEFAIATNAPVVSDDLTRETRFTPSKFLLRHGIVSGIVVPISANKLAPWGVIGAHSRTHRHFDTADVDFLRAVAGVLAQAVERDRVDQQLVLHAAQQSAIAELSRIALKSVDTATDICCNIVMDVLDVEHAVFLDLNVATRTLHRRAGSRWTGEREMGISLAEEHPIAAACVSNVPVMLDLEGSDGYAIPVASTTDDYGVLAFCTRKKRTFIEADVEFVQSLANILADAIERERARGALAVSEQRYREVIEGASEIIFTLDAEGRFVTLNGAFEHVTGWACRDWIGRPFAPLLHPDDAVRVTEIFQRMFDEQTPIPMELRILGRERVVVIDVSSFPRVENGVTTAISGFARDVTEARRAADDRDALTRSLELLLESTVEGILTVDLEGRCTMWNRAAAQILGRGDDEISGAKLEMLLFNGTSPAVSPCPILEVARSGNVYTAAKDTFWRSDGTTVPVEFSAAPIIDAGVPVGVVISFSDVTERRKLEMKLEQADRLTSLGRLAATIAHEFNNVLMGISPFVEVIKRGKNVETSLEHIGRAVKRGKRITGDILRFTRPAQPVRVAFDAVSWLDSITVEARTLFPPHCRIQSKAAPGIRIDGDPHQLQQIFTNLILNARDAMGSTGGTLTIEARREAPGAKLVFPVESPERFAHFIVTDTGGGIPPETLRHIFEPLFTTKKNGTGLGLAVAHQVVQRHGGEIFVESTPGLGTTFHIFLPLTEAALTADGESRVETPVTGVRRVLLVEDDPSVATGIASLLEMEGLTVQMVETGAAAIRAVDTGTPDVIVLDVGLPDMEGTSVYNAIVAKYPRIPIIFSTGHADRARLDSLIANANVGYLLKPYDGSALLDAIREVMQ
jgi:PAS domain S-box-containing protein